MLRRKLLRDLSRQRWQVGAAILVLILGVAMFDASYDAYRDLGQSYRQTEMKTRAADVTFEVARVDEKSLTALRGMPGVAAVAADTIADVPMRITDKQSGKVRLLLGRLIGVPLGAQPAVDRVIVAKGRYPDKADEVIIEQHFADFFHLLPGDTLSAAGESLHVVGIGESAAYLWVTKSRQEPMPSPREFGVVFAGNETVKAIAKRATDNRLALLFSPGAARTNVLSRVREALGPEAIIAETPLGKMPGIELLRLDIDGLRLLAIAFPLMFLIVAAFITAALIARRVEEERSIVGTLLAIGMRPARVLRHYLGYGAVVASIGAVAGSALGYWLGVLMTQSYAEELHIPFVTTALHLGVMFVGAVLALVLPVLACFAPARRAAALAPAEAMRPVAPQVAPKGWSARARRIPLWLRMSLRELRRQPARNLGTIIGVISALLLIIVTSGMLDATERGMDLSNRSLNYDMRVDFDAPLPRAELLKTVSAIAGVNQAQTSLTLPVLVTADASKKNYETLVEEAGHSMLRAFAVSGSEVAPRAHGIVVTRAIATKLAVKVGDALSMRVLPSGPTLQLRLDALSDSMMGSTVLVQPADLRDALGAGDVATTALLRVDEKKAEDVRQVLEQLPHLSRISETGELRASLSQVTGLSVLLLILMLLFAAVLAGAILFNTSTISIFERRRELTTLRTIGFRMGAIIRLVTLQNVILGLIGVAIGLPLSLLALAGFLHLFSSDLFSLPFWIYPRTVIVAVSSMLVVLLVAEWPALRHLARLNLAEATKTRE